MNIDDIQKQIELYKNQNKKLFATTSLQTQSIVLLHILKTIDRSIPVYFINTGFHFPETMKFREQVSKELDIDILIIDPSISKHLQQEIDRIRTSGLSIQPTIFTERRNVNLQYSTHPERNTVLLLLYWNAWWAWFCSTCPSQTVR